MPKYQKEEARLNYQTNVEKATIVALILVILLFLFFPTFDLTRKEDSEVVFTSLSIEDIPLTRQGTRRKPPPKPAVPIPSDDDLIPEDLTIEETDLNFDLASEQLGPGVLSGRPAIFQPRPVFEVIPEYPQELQKKGIEGFVKLHLHVDKAGRVIKAIVLENTTNSKVCANASLSAALKCRYIPAKSSGKAVDIWINRTYTFGLQR
ncbi:energy transducer TonB [candidate division KSB1 bacterium]|nr:energy transducer TonB [candidate division KSB1 bacterium]MBL7092363.1 energy transducer TonB [candidate division KSB1 bacterium]